MSPGDQRGQDHEERLEAGLVARIENLLEDVRAERHRRQDALEVEPPQKARGAEGGIRLLHFLKKWPRRFAGLEEPLLGFVTILDTVGAQLVGPAGEIGLLEDRQQESEGHTSVTESGSESPATMAA